MKFSDRLQEIIDSKFNRIKRRLALKANLDANTLQAYFKRGSIPGYEIAKKIADVGDVNVSWLLEGKGPKKKLPDPVIIQNSSISQVPVISSGPCGEWRDLTDLDYPAGVADSFRPAYTKDQNAFYLVAHGDSMVGGNIEEGDLLLVEPNAEWHDGNIVFAKSDEGCTIKLIFRHGDKIELRPMNPAHKSLFVSDDESLKVMRVVSITKEC